MRLIWGDKDWARPSEREHDRGLLPSAEMVTVEMAGTSCRSIDDAVIEQIRILARL